MNSEDEVDMDLTRRIYMKDPITAYLIFSPSEFLLLGVEGWTSVTLPLG